MIGRPQAVTAPGRQGEQSFRHFLFQLIPGPGQGVLGVDRAVEAQTVAPHADFSLADSISAAVGWMGLRISVPHSINSGINRATEPQEWCIIFAWGAFSRMKSFSRRRAGMSVSRKVAGADHQRGLGTVILGGLHDIHVRPRLTQQDLIYIKLDLQQLLDDPFRERRDRR